MPAARLTSKGQITVPRDVRVRMGLHTGDVVEFIPQDKGFRLRRRAAGSRLDRWVGRLRSRLAARSDELIEALRGR